MARIGGHRSNFVNLGCVDVVDLCCFDGIGRSVDCCVWPMKWRTYDCFCSEALSFLGSRSSISNPSIQVQASAWTTKPKECRFGQASPLGQ